MHSCAIISIRAFNRDKLFQYKQGKQIIMTLYEFDLAYI